MEMEEEQVVGRRKEAMEWERRRKGTKERRKEVLEEDGRREGLKEKKELREGGNERKELEGRRECRRRGGGN